jgi:tetratricopeptide (TPR) repeat protein
MDAIDAEAVRVSRVSRTTRLTTIVLCAAAVSGALHALPDGVSANFKQGVSAYDHAAYTTAAQHFQRVVSRAPRAVDGWAHLGAAAFSAGDSATAVRAWQRALRLDPLDAEARERIDAVQPAQLRERGYVPALPVNALAWAAFVCWIAAWVVLGIPPHRRPEHARALAGGGIAIAVVLLASAVEVHKRLDPRGLAVLRTSRMLLAAPASSAAIASAAIGETGALSAREGAWVHIAFDGARAGWVPLASVLPLDEIAPPQD